MLELREPWPSERGSQDRRLQLQLPLDLAARDVWFLPLVPVRELGISAASAGHGTFPAEGLGIRTEEGWEGTFGHRRGDYTWSSARRVASIPD